jgi:KDO2-lipid IV(A) lauroyltransferase
MSRKHTRQFKYYIIDPLIAVIVFALYGIFLIMPFSWASAIGSRIARTIGPYLKVSTIARKNLDYVMPELAGQKDQLIQDMWDNLGRVGCEYPHLTHLKLVDNPALMEIRGKDVLDRVLAENRPVIFFSAHLGNWEIFSIYMSQYGVKAALVYRRANNRFLDWLIQAARERNGFRFIPKGRAGSRDLVEALHNNGRIAMLVDQRMSDGEQINFMGKPAWTGTGAARLAIRYNALLVPVDIERRHDKRFRLTFFEPLPLPEGTDTAAATELMIQMHSWLEKFIRARPAQWFWVHRRWGKI